jgi:putative chitobiose transport system permease protein
MTPPSVPSPMRLEPVKPRVKPMTAQRIISSVLTYSLLIAIGIFAVFPFVWTFAISITDKTFAGGTSIYNFPGSLFPQRVTLHNFFEVFTKFSLAKYLFNSVIITVGTVIGTLAVSAFAAYPLSRLKFPGQQFIFAAILATLVLPNETGFIVNILTLQKMGLLNTYAGVVIPIIATAFGIFVMRQAYLSIPEALLEASRIDGATELQILWRVMIPLSIPTLTALGIFTLVNTWNSYFWPSIALLGAQELHPLSVVMLKLKGQFNYDVFNVAAGAMILMLPVLAVFLAAQKLFMRGLDGAVK